MWMKVIVLIGLYLSYVRSQLTYDVVQNILKENKSTNGCKKQYGTLISNDTFSLFKMFDASSFSGLQHGVLEGKFFDFGAYDECLSVSTIDETIFGKYCLARIPFSELRNLIPKYDIPADLLSLPNTLARHTQLLHGSKDKSNKSMVGLHFGTCIPNDCSASQVEEYVNAVSPVPVYYVEDYCYDRRTNTVLTGAAIGGIIVLAVILVISIMSTIFDLWTCHNETKTRYEALTIFSVYTHGKSLFTFTTSEDQLPCLNGIKALSMIRVIMIHEYGAHLPNAARENMLLYIDEVFATRGTIAVDLFFAISGVLLVYTMLKPVPFRIGDVPMFYLRRYLRLTPAYAIVILVLGTGLFTYVGSGPLWYATNEQHSFCKEYWWSALLYIQNYVNLHKMCLGPSWYLSVDMQIFFLSPLILIPLKNHKEKTLIGLFFLALLGVVSPFINAYINNYGATAYNRNSVTYRNLYDQTHARFGPFVIGMIAGYYIHQIKGGQKLEIRPIKSSIVLIICLAVLYACAYIGPVVPNIPLSNATYHSLHRMIGSTAVMVIVILCVSGNAAPVNWFLTLNFLQFLGKLSYSMYLIHYPVIEAKKLSIRTTSYYSQLDWITNFMGNVFITICLSIVLHLVVECPVIALQRRFLKPSKPKTKPGDKV